MSVPGRISSVLFICKFEVDFFISLGYHDWVGHFGITMIARPTRSLSNFDNTGHSMLNGGKIYTNIPVQDICIASMYVEFGSGFHDTYVGIW